MKTKVLLCILAFLLFFLSALWLTQTVFLTDIYQSIRTSYVKDVIRSLSEELDRTDLENEISTQAEQSQICISVYRMDGVRAVPLVSAHVNKVCLIHNSFSYDQFNEMYNGALNEKIFTKQIRPIKETSQNQHGLFRLREDRSVTLLASSLVKTGSNTYLILANTTVTPNPATETVLHFLVIVITIILLIGAFILALILPKMLTRPLEKMSHEAERLATGDYNIHFDGGHLRETEELADALNYAASELSTISEMQKELLANISHDLRTPLTMIAGYSEVMRDIPGEMNAENMQVIIDETARLSSLVNDTLDLSRLTEGTPSLNRTVFSLTLLLQETVQRYNQMMASQGYRLILEAETNVMVQADQTRILQVLYNLINNAITYSGDSHTVKILQSLNCSSVRVSVIDNGPGIPEDQLPFIWDRYFKLKEYHRRGITGNGLGLSIVKSILKMHNADFGVISKLGSGSTFWFELPREDNPHEKDGPNANNT